MLFFGMSSFHLSTLSCAWNQEGINIQNEVAATSLWGADAFLCFFTHQAEKSVCSLQVKLQETFRKNNMKTSHQGLKSILLNSRRKHALL